jgi:hypothetical protein
MATIEQVLGQARARGMEVSDTTYRATAAGIGPYPETPVGPVLRAIRVVYSGPVTLETDPAADHDQALAGAVLTPSADAAVRELVETLLAACQAEGVDLWAGHSSAGIGCFVQYSPPASSAAARLADDIRVTRLRVRQWPGVGHEERLEQLMSQAST